MWSRIVIPRRFAQDDKPGRRHDKPGRLDDKQKNAMNKQ